MWTSSLLILECTALTTVPTCHLGCDPPQQCKVSRAYYPDSLEEEPSVQRGERLVQNNTVAAKSDKSENEIQFSSVQFSHSVVSDSLRPHEPQHTRPLHPSPTPGAYPNSCPLSQWCHPTISSFCCPLFLLPSIFPSIRVFSDESALLIRRPKYWSFSWD